MASAFLAMFTVFGVAYSFGAFFGPMADEFSSERGETAFFFALTTFLYFALGVVSGRIADRIGPRPVLIFGAVALVGGLLATSRVQSLWAGYLTYGLGVGIGVACAYVPMVAAVGGWFESGRTTALGIAVAGIGMGTLVMAPLSERLIEARGWRETYVILAVGSGVLLAASCFGAHRPPAMASGPAPPPLASTIGRSRAFATLYGSVLLLAVALFVPFVFLGDYLAERNIAGSGGLLVGVIGLASVVGRLGLGAVASRFDVLTIYRTSILSIGLSFGLWLIAGSSYWILVIFSVVMGVAYGGFIALAPAVAAEAFGTVGLGGILGALYTAAGIGGLIGPPIMGLVIDQSGYRTALVVCAALGVSSAATLLLLQPRSSRSGIEPSRDGIYHRQRARLRR